MRKLLMVLRAALNSLTLHKLRSFLTMLGVVIGVGAVIALVAVGEGAQAQVVSQFQALGSNLLTVTARTNFGFQRGGLRQSTRQLTSADVDAIRGLATSVKLIAPDFGANATVTYGGKTTSTGVTGVTEEYSIVRNWGVARASSPPTMTTTWRWWSFWARRPSRTCSAAPRPTRSARPCASTDRTTRWWAF